MMMREMVDRGVSPREIATDTTNYHEATVLKHVNGHCNCDGKEHLSYHDCMKLRIQRRKGAPVSTLAMLSGRPRRTISQHINGRCHHDDGIAPPETHPNGVLKSESRL